MFDTAIFLRVRPGAHPISRSQLTRLGFALGTLLPLLLACPLSMSTGLSAATTQPTGIAAMPANTETVGRKPDGRAVTPASQILTPAGKQVDLPELRPQAIALSPDGKILITTGKTGELCVLNPATGDILQKVPMPPETGSLEPDVVSTHILKPDKGEQLSYTGLVFSPDGKRIYLSNVNGSIKVFTVNPAGQVEGLGSLALPKTTLPRRSAEIPAGIALSPDGTRIFVALNLSNRLIEMDSTTGKTLNLFDTGVAPYDVVLVGNKVYVSNWGGRRPETNSLTGPAGRGTLVRVDPKRHIASEGSVTVIDLAQRKVTAEIMTGLHSSAMALHPGGRYLVVANAGEDSLSIIDTRKDVVADTFSLRWQPKDYFGASPNALAFDRQGKWLYVCNGTQNAIAAVQFRPTSSKLRGLIPTGWFPGAIAVDPARSTLHVANIKGMGSGRRTLPNESPKYSSHQYVGSLSLIPIPNRDALVAHTRQALANCRREMIEASQLPARPGQPARPVPERVGEPSVFKHVIYIIKENRTYDQVFGDIKEGNGEPKLCTFGEKYTPNQHKMVREFVLLDNIYCAGILSADGHQWSTTAFATDYMEKSFAGFPRSYPDGMEDDDVDALAYSPGGFIWDNAIEHGKTLRDYGEFAIEVTGWRDPKRKPAPKFIDYYRDFISGKNETLMASRPAIESLRPYLNTNTVGWGMSVPDVYRAARFIEDLKAFEKAGEAPNLMIICLPNDHTSGTSPGMPTPGAHVADNDLAFGQIVEAVSHSTFWKDTCIFAIEDDPQAGYDHVSGYRTTGYVVSPYTKRRQVVSSQYNQPGMLRTIELILGLPPMNTMDAAATPMFDCFTTTPDFTPFKAVTNNIPLDELNPPAKAIVNPVLRRDAEISAKLPLDKVDQCDEDELNRILWNAQMGPQTPYPHWAVIPKSQRRD